MDAATATTAAADDEEARVHGEELMDDLMTGDEPAAGADKGWEMPG
eukprot:gene46383-51056_t